MVAVGGVRRSNTEQVASGGWGWDIKVHGGTGRWGEGVCQRMLAPGRGLWQDSDFGRLFLHPHVLPSLACPPQPSQRVWAKLGAALLCWAVTGRWWKGLPRKVLETPEPPGFPPNAWEFGGLCPRGKSPTFPAVLFGQGS